jgi:hypothetical protein
MVDDHEYVVGDGPRSLLLTDTYCETPQGASQEGRRLPSAPGTLPQDAAQVAIPFARFASVPFAGTLMVPRTYSGPRCQARCVPKATHIRPDLGPYVPCRNEIAPRNTVEWREWRVQRRHSRAALLLEGGNLAIQHLNELQHQGESCPMVRCALAWEGECSLGTRVLHGSPR